MKKWNAAEIVELNIAETANGVCPGAYETFISDDSVQDLESAKKALEETKEAIEKWLNGDNDDVNGNS